MIQPPVDGRATAVSTTQRRRMPSSGLVLLVADPDTSHQERLVKDLHGRGVETIWCHDGASALVAYGRVEPHAVLVAPHLDRPRREAR